jgi:hypothetical protein
MYTVTLSGRRSEHDVERELQDVREELRWLMAQLESRQHTDLIATLNGIPVPREVSQA